MRSHLLNLAAAALLPLTLSCASSPSRKSAPEPAHAAASRQVPMLQVANHNWREVNVYVLVGGSRFRLGSVNTQRSARFALEHVPGWESHPLRLYVDPVGASESYTSEEFMLGQGQWADCIVEGQLALSRYSVRSY